MKIGFILIFQVIIIFYADAQKKKKNPTPIKYDKISAKFNNPGQVRDRFKDEIFKPDMPSRWVNRYVAPFSSFWMDYCDPRHCNQYHKQVCGLNRKKMKFRYFKSGCDLGLHNYCSKYRGVLKYDPVDVKFCAMYVLYLRIGCPQSCNDEPLDPVCAIDSTNEPVIFVNQCSMDMENCKRKDDSVYEEVHMAMCAYYVKHGVIMSPTYLQLSMNRSDENVAYDIID